MKIKNKKHKTINIIVIFILLIIFSIILFIKYYSNIAYPIVNSYAKEEARKFIVLVINNAVTKEIIDKIDDDIFAVNYNDNGEILLIDYNYNVTSKILKSVTNLVESRIYDIENGNFDNIDIEKIKNYNNDSLKKGVIVEVPIGIITKSVFLNNIGPKIPIKVSFIGNVLTGFSTDVTEYGINNALLKLMIDISVDVKIIMPISSDDLTVKCSVPISIRIIQGKIPNYYMNGFTTKSNLDYDT